MYDGSWERREKKRKEKGMDGWMFSCEEGRGEGEREGKKARRIV